MMAGKNNVALRELHDKIDQKNVLIFELAYVSR